MKKTLLVTFGAIVLALSLSPPVKADAFLSLSNGATTLSCNNSTAAGVTACTSSGFTTSLSSNAISFGGTVGGYVGNFFVLGNQPGNAGLATANLSGNSVTNIS